MKPKIHTDDIFDNEILATFCPEDHQAKIKNTLFKYRTPLKHFVKAYSYLSANNKVEVSYNAISAAIKRFDCFIDG